MPGCKACDEESSGVKRRGIPFNDTPECAEKKGVFRERLREMKMLSADQNPHVMVPVAGPLLTWPGTSETARTVEPDPIVRRGLKRASDVVIWESLPSVR